MTVAETQPNDDALGDDAIVWRRVHRTQLDPAAQPPRPMSALFRDARDEMSLHLASETSEALLSVKYPQHGIVALCVGDLRHIAGLDVVRAPTAEDASHMLAKGKVTTGQARRLRDVARWIRLVPDVPPAS